MLFFEFPVSLRPTELLPFAHRKVIIEFKVSRFPTRILLQREDYLADSGATAQLFEALFAEGFFGGEGRAYNVAIKHALRSVWFKLSASESSPLTKYHGTTRTSLWAGKTQNNVMAFSPSGCIG
jgi:hypothetical protein